MDNVMLVYSTTPDLDTAKKIAQALVGEKLAACVGMMPGYQSVYRWQGAVLEASEVCLMIKTTKNQFAALSEKLVALHPYDVPELIAVPVTAGLPSYLQWVKDETSA
ncbi:divalent-cation tolerance protein CutA [Oxalobacter vibrioformis]|uniref:Divalent-cation tolerance protein CutA n=1 Tax=Oxalobacter vibrioformis TaxID=933080 RepID=A0A9E9LT84_9BURK|nr:divalent-cation tolerance protein CutA [Oxalobacter vibrioformis]NLC23754.1 divalent-cation tolerance protein CutA [Oxalobacter sp.]WAW09215.1 divalent-cation tolerance protein CutA [Oxalobacter vibrioformis]